MASSDRTREQRLRRMADRQGLKLVKSGRRDPRALDYATYMFVSQLTNTVVAGVGALGRPEFSIDDVEKYLTSDRDKTS